LQSEVEVLATRRARVALDPDGLASHHVLARLHEDGRQVGVQREDAARVLDMNDVAPPEVAPVIVPAVEVGGTAAPEREGRAVGRSEDDVGRERRRGGQIQREAAGVRAHAV
jgi:hypothetical protein